MGNAFVDDRILLIVSRSGVLMAGEEAINFGRRYPGSVSVMVKAAAVDPAALKSLLDYALQQAFSVGSKLNEETK